MKTIFEGTINGEKFNSVQAYNARMIELMNAGVNVDASSSTKSVDESSNCDRCTCDKSESTLDKAVKEIIDAYTSVNKDADTEDVEVTLYPYFDEDDAYYLDTLVTHDPSVNKKNFDEVCDHITEAWSEILEFLTCDNICVCDKKEYLNDVHDIIASINNDDKANKNALNNINEQKMKAEAEFAEAKMRYEQTISSLNDSKTVLDGATSIINLLHEFYQNVEAEGLQAIKGNPVCECNSDNKCLNKTNINTDVKEVSPQIEMELAEAFGKLFGGLLKDIDLSKLK
jgi:hypothetical protein